MEIWLEEDAAARRHKRLRELVDKRGSMDVGRILEPVECSECYTLMDHEPHEGTALCTRCGSKVATECMFRDLDSKYEFGVMSSGRVHIQELSARELRTTFKKRGATAQRCINNTRFAPYGG